MLAQDLWTVQTASRTPTNLLPKPAYTFTVSVSNTVQELKVLREQREALDDQIERLEWTLQQGHRAAATVDEPDDEIQEVRIPP